MTAPIGVEWKPVEEEKPVQTITVTLVINVPEHAHVSRNVATGQIMIDDITVNDLTDLRDSISDQINEVQKRNGWEPF
jgi:hypothetical protein